MAAKKNSQKRGIHLVKPEPENSDNLLRKCMAKQFSTGEIVPQSGIYEVMHAEHRLPHEVTLLRANEFPPCAQCGNEVQFTLLRVVTVDRFSVTLNSLPELPQSAEARAAAAGEDDAEKAS